MPVDCVVCQEEEEEEGEEEEAEEEGLRIYLEALYFLFVSRH